MKRKNTRTSFEHCMIDAHKIMKSVTENPFKDDCFIFSDLLARKLKKLDEQTREVFMHKIDN